jgi:hypothetical protein
VKVLQISRQGAETSVSSKNLVIAHGVYYIYPRSRTIERHDVSCSAWPESRAPTGCAAPNSMFRQPGREPAEPPHVSINLRIRQPAQTKVQAIGIKRSPMQSTRMEATRVYRQRAQTTCTDNVHRQSSQTECTETLGIHTFPHLYSRTSQSVCHRLSIHPGLGYLAESLPSVVHPSCVRARVPRKEFAIGCPSILYARTGIRKELAICDTIHPVCAHGYLAKSLPSVTPSTRLQAAEPHDVPATPRTRSRAPVLLCSCMRERLPL